MDVLLAKILSIGIFILLTVGVGSLPYFLILRGSRSLISARYKDSILACLNCFAGGVFLGTLLLHLFTEGAEDLEEYKLKAGWESDFPWFNVFIFAGMMLVALIEHFAHKCVNSNSIHDRVNIVSSEHTFDSYQNQEAPLLSNKSRKQHGYGSTIEDVEHQNGNMDNTDSNTPAHTCVHTNDTPSSMKAYMLLAALSFHTIFDGLAVGLLKEEKTVWAVFGGIAAHRAVVVFCLGFELYKTHVVAPLKALLQIFIFSLMSPIGVGIGIALTEGSIDENAKLLASAVMQGLSAGTFLYVCFLEILCPYMGSSCVKGSKFIYFVCVSVGFGIMAIVKAFDAD